MVVCLVCFASVFILIQIQMMLSEVEANARADMHQLMLNGFSQELWQYKTVW